MKTIAIAVGILAISLFIASPCFAEDGHNVPDQLGDIFSGKGNTYGGIEIINIPLPIVEALTLTVWADAMVGEIDEGIDRDVRGGAKVVLDWQKIFK